MNVVRAIFFQNQGTFLKILKKDREGLPPALVTRLTRNLIFNIWTIHQALIYKKENFHPYVKNYKVHIFNIISPTQYANFSYDNSIIIRSNLDDTSCRNSNCINCKITLCYQFCRIKNIELINILFLIQRKHQSKKR